MIEQRCAIVAVLGAPNAGKSTLVNALVGAKVAAVTQKVQTTRALVRGIAMCDSVQLVLIDTPGVFAPKRRLDRAMVAAAWSAPVRSTARSMFHRGSEAPRSSRRKPDILMAMQADPVVRVLEAL